MRRHADFTFHQEKTEIILKHSVFGHGKGRIYVNSKASAVISSQFGMHMHPDLATSTFFAPSRMHRRLPNTNARAYAIKKIDVPSPLVHGFTGVGWGRPESRARGEEHGARGRPTLLDQISG